MIYTVTFNPALDYIVRIPHLNMDSINRVEKATVRAGGKGRQCIVCSEKSRT